MSEPTLCPNCGWTGTIEEADRDGVKRCPICETDIEIVD